MLTNETSVCCRLATKSTNRRLKDYEDTPLTRSLARMLVPALLWPFPVIVQCCETEKAMCVDAKVNLAL